MKKVSFGKTAVYVSGVLLSILLVVFGVRFIERNDPEKTGYDIVLFGDSLMAYSQDETSVASLIAEYSGMSVADLSFGGTLAALTTGEYTPGSHRNFLSLSAITRAFLTNDFSLQINANAKAIATEYFDERVGAMQKVDLEKCRIVIIGQCLNDYHCSVPIGETDSTDRYTYCGALRSAVEDIRKINPDVRIIFVSPTEKWMLDGTNASDFDYGGGVLDDYVRAQKEMAEVLGVEYLSLYDLYKNEYVTEDGKVLTGRLYTADGTHPDLYGRIVIARAITGHIEGN